MFPGQIASQATNTIGEPLGLLGVDQRDESRADLDAGTIRLHELAQLMFLTRLKWLLGSRFGFRFGGGFLFDVAQEQQNSTGEQQERKFGQTRGQR